MTANELIKQVRMATNDNNAAKVSDWQMVDAINSVLNVLYNELGTFSNDLLYKSAKLKMENGRAELPEDFLCMVDVFRGDTVLLSASKSFALTPYTYEIRGNEIYAQAQSLTIDYKPSAPSITMDSLDEDLPFPNFFNELIKRQTIAALGGDLSLQDIAVAVRQIAANRSYGALEMHGTWSERI